MRLGVVSDTHGRLETTARAVQELRKRDVDVVIHCGDIGSPSIVYEFTEWPTHFVFGNVDHDTVSLTHAIRDAGLTGHDRFGELELAGRRIAFLHSDDTHRFQSTIASGNYDLVCYGHTHKFEFHDDPSGSRVLNPGALHRAKQHTFAIVDLDSLDVEFVDVSETR